MEARDVHHICQEFVDDGSETENFLFTFMKTCTDKVTWEFATYISKLSNTSVQRMIGSPQASTLMSRHGSREEKLSSNQQKKRSQPRSLLSKAAQSCPVDHDNVVSYKEVVEEYYFHRGRRYDGLSCSACKKPFASDKNKSAKGWSDKKGIPLPKNGLKAYACEKFEAGATCCGFMLCNSCHLEKLECSGSKRRRRGADAGPTPSAKRPIFK